MTKGIGSIMALIRPPAIAGTFYPADPAGLRAAVEKFVRATPSEGPVPKAIIAPHAGYVYSGACAGAAYARLLPDQAQITRIVLLGPCHRVAVRGLATSSADYWKTPLGAMPLDRGVLAGLSDLPQVATHDGTHQQEHSLEVHLPFLQVCFPQANLMPFVVGQASAEEVAGVLERLWGGPETRIVISTDLSHFLDYDACNALDTRTAQAVEALDYAAIGRDQACGRIPMSGLLHLAKQRGMRIERVGLCNSADTVGDPARVVGYGSWALYE
jgi:MEMO1 family protein